MKPDAPPEAPDARDLASAYCRVDGLPVNAEKRGDLIDGENGEVFAADVARGLTRGGSYGVWGRSISGVLHEEPACATDRRFPRAIKNKWDM